MSLYVSIFYSIFRVPVKRVKSARVISMWSNYYGNRNMTLSKFLIYYFNCKLLNLFLDPSFLFSLYIPSFYTRFRVPVKRVKVSESYFDVVELLRQP